MNWETLRHMIGDMYDEEELLSVRVKLPDGSIVTPTRFERDSYGDWVLIVEQAVAAEIDRRIPVPTS